MESPSAYVNILRPYRTSGLYLAFRQSGMKKVELARALNIPKTNMDRLFDFRNHSRLDQLEAAFAAVGKRLVYLGSGCGIDRTPSALLARSLR